MQATNPTPSVLEVQRIVARLLVDRPFRSAIQRAKHRASRDGSSQPAIKMDDISWGRLGFYADMLVNKRWRFVQKVLPNTSRLVATHAPDLVEDAFAVPPPRRSGQSELTANTAWFHRFLSGIVTWDDLGLPHLASILEFEFRRFQLVTTVDACRQANQAARRLRTACVDIDVSEARLIMSRHVRVLDLAYNAPELMGDPSLAPEPKRTLLLMAKVTAEPRVVLERISDLTRDLLEACDGSGTGSEIACLLWENNRRSRSVDPAEFRSQALKMAQRLYAHGVLGISEGH